MEKWELAYKDYQNGMKYKEIAEKHNVSINTVKSWKSRKWNEGAIKDKKVAHKNKKGCTQKSPKNKVTEERVSDILDTLDYYGISEQQRRFADNYIESANIYQSAIKAGYSKEYSKARSYLLLEIVGIKEYIDDHLKVLASDKIATQEEVLRKLTKILNREEKESQVVTVKQKVEKWVDIGGKPKKQVLEKEVPEIVEYPTKVSDVIKAGNSLLKRFDIMQKDEDELRLAQIEKAKADASLASKKANEDDKKSAPIQINIAPLERPENE